MARTARRVSCFDCVYKDAASRRSVTLVNEYRDVCWRDAITAKLPISPGERDELMDALLARCRWVEIYYLWRPNLRDEADNHLIELALASGADTVLTNNLPDVATGELRFPGLRILRPEQFLIEVER